MGRLIWLAAALLAGAGCRQRAEAVQDEVRLRELVRQRMPAIERIVGLKFKRMPAVAQRTREQVRDYIVRKLDSDLPPPEFAGAEAAYKLFGLIPDSLDLRARLVALLNEQVAGYYDPDSATLFIPAGQTDSSALRTTVTHELVHALQDQYANLDSLIQQKRANDRRSAAQAILEGQATLVQILVMMPERTLETLPDFQDNRNAVRNQQATMKEFAGAPMWLRETLVFPYLAGADFVKWFEQTHPGREPYGAAMPVSTEQILHPARYAAGDAPVQLAFAGPAAGAVRYQDDLGEFESGLLLSQLLADTVDLSASADAAGWGGDRYEVLAVPAGGDALVWYSVWDNTAAADRWARDLERGWASRARTGRRSSITRLDVGGHPGVQLVDAPAAWPGWKALPLVRVVTP
ncbi:MAG TPA: hypothetical protein VNH63_13220 [Gemmatimonadales bacterium]|nr:hypothetical protein [Gemmatimonadales bacterium]